jgi:hypothetical protein
MRRDARDNRQPVWAPRRHRVYSMAAVLSASSTTPCPQLGEAMMARPNPDILPIWRTPSGGVRVTTRARGADCLQTRLGHHDGARTPTPRRPAWGRRRRTRQGPQWDRPGGKPSCRSLPRQHGPSGAHRPRDEDRLGHGPRNRLVDTPGDRKSVVDQPLASHQGDTAATDCTRGRPGSDGNSRRWVDDDVAVARTSAEAEAVSHR